MFHVWEQKIEIEGKGDSKGAAFQQALSAMKRKLTQELPDVLLQIEPQNVEVLSAKETRYTERFLGLFFPRVRARYEIRVRIHIKIRAVKLDEIAFEQQTESLSPPRRILHLR